MTTLATATVLSSAAPSAFFDRWTDMASWPDCSVYRGWVRPAGAFAEGATGQLKPKGGPKVRFVVERLVPGEGFDDVSMLVGARLTFSHRVTAQLLGGCRVDVTVSMTGPLAPLWRRVIGKGIAASLQRDLDALAAAAERAPAAID